jgi:N utilization substance protein A
LLESGIATVEKLGSMTPEELEAIQGIGPEMVEKIQQAVNAYYEQFDGGGAEAGEAEVSPGEASLNEIEASQAQANQAQANQAEPVAEEPVGETPVEMQTETQEAEPGVESPDSVGAESDTIKDINSSAHAPDEKVEGHES